MHKKLLMSAALLGLASGPVLAQNTSPTTTSPPAPNESSGVLPMRGQMHHGAMAGPHGRAMPEDASAEATEAGTGHEYRGGVGSPSSARASNIDQANTRSEIAPRLPDPSAASSTPEAYLVAAQRALASGKTGAAQEALERAETRVLSRSTEQSMATSPADMPMVQQIGAARRALASRDMAAAKAAITAAMGNGT